MLFMSGDAPFFIDYLPSGEADCQQPILAADIFPPCPPRPALPN